MQLIPLTNDGCRKVVTTTDAGVLTFTTYYLPLVKSWLCDIEDADGNVFATGLNLVIAVDNLLKGRNILNDFILRVISDDIENNSPDSLGNTCWVVLASKDEYMPEIYREAA